MIFIKKIMIKTENLQGDKIGSVFIFCHIWKVAEKGSPSLFKIINLNSIPETSNVKKTLKKSKIAILFYLKSMFLTLHSLCLSNKSIGCFIHIYFSIENNYKLLIGPKRLFSQFWRNEKQIFVDLYSENLWKHVVSWILCRFK